MEIESLYGKNKADFFLQQHCEILDYGVWHYLVRTPVGEYHICEYSSLKGGLSPQKVFINDNASAEKYFHRICRKIIDGKM